MDYLFNEEHQLIRSVVREFAENVIRPQARKLDEDETFSIDITKKMGDLGLFGMTVPEEFNGKGTDYLSYIIAVEELARIDGSQAATVAAHNSLGVAPISMYGTQKQKEKYIPRLCTGEALWAFGLTEPEAGSDSRNTKTTGKRDNGHWIIDGAKTFITNGASAISAGVTVQLVSGGVSDKKEFSCVLVERDTPGFTAKPMHGKLMWRASDTSEMCFENCRVPYENLLGKEGQGSHIMLATLDYGRLSIAAMGLGCAQGAYELALDYSKKRVQFGKPIVKFQVTAFKLADMALKIELARNLLYKACWLADNALPFQKESAMAKLYCSEIAREIADEALQIHGGYGLMKEYAIERFYRDQRLLQIGEGTSEIQRLVISRLIGC